MTTASIPMTMMGMGQILGGAGQAAGGLSSLFSEGRISGQQIRKSIKNQIEARAMYSRRYGEKYGFHPLTMLGINPAGGPMGRPTGGDKGRALERMGQGVNRMLQAGQSEIQKAQARLLNLRGDQIEQQIANDSPEGQQDVPTTAAGVVLDPVPKEKMFQVTPKQPQVTHGVEVGPEAFGRIVNMPGGGSKIMPTQSLQETTSEGIHAWEYAAQYINRLAKGNSFWLLDTHKGRKWRNELRKQQRMFDDRVRPNEEYRYDTVSQSWYGGYPNQGKLFTSYGLRRFGTKPEAAYPNMKLQSPRRPKLKTRKQIRRSPLYFD